MIFLQEKNVFIIGSKGIPAKYGGFETFVEMLTGNQINDSIKYHVSCISHENDHEFTHNNARCFNVKVPDIKSATAVLYDLLSLKKSVDFIAKNNLKNSSIYILACRIGPFLPLFKPLFKKYGISIFLNPDGHEWKRSKWNKFIQKYWKFSERLMVKFSDLIICDSRGIEEYILNEYKSYRKQSLFIPYGADVAPSKIQDNDPKLLEFFNKNQLKEKKYFLIVGRFVPENNYELIIQEFLKSKTLKDLVIISNVENNKFYHSLLENTKFDKDSRIKFVGTVYNQELLKKIREKAFGYFHGHEVGGTNPSLLEALASTDLNILLDVNFNQEVAEQGALYFDKRDGSLKHLIEEVEELDQDKLNYYQKESTNRIKKYYSWTDVIQKYENTFLNHLEEFK